MLSLSAPRSLSPDGLERLSMSWSKGLLSTVHKTVQLKNALVQARGTENAIVFLEVSPSCIFPPCHMAVKEAFVKPAKADLSCFVLSCCAALCYVVCRKCICAILSRGDTDSSLLVTDYKRQFCIPATHDLAQVK